MSIETEFQSTIQNVQNAYNGLNNLGATIPQNKTIENIKSCLDEIYDRLPKTEFEEGESVTLENTLKGKLDFDNGVVGIGQSSQDSTQGYNELNIYVLHPKGYTETVSGVIFKYNDDGSVTATGTATADINYFLGSRATLGDIFNGTYYLSGCTNGSNSTYFLSMWADGIGVYPQTTTEVATNKTSGVNWNIVIAVKNGASVNYTFYPMMSKTSGKSFEPYTGGQASPNPSYPQTINSVTGNQDVVVSGINKLQQKLPTTTLNGITCTNNGDGSYTFSGTASANVNFRIDQSTTDGTDNLNTYKAPYTMVASIVTGTPIGSMFLGGYSDSESWSTPLCNIGTVRTITSNINNAFCYIRFETGNVVNETIYPMILDGEYTSSNIPNFEPYITPTSYQLSLGDIELCGIGNYKDELIYDVENDKVYKNEKIGKKIFTGASNESWSLNTINQYGIANFLNTSLTDYNITMGDSNGLCNYFEPQTSVIAQTTTSGFLINNQKYLYVRIESSIVSTVEAFKTWLSTHNTKVIYLKATPTEIEITDQTLINQVKALYNAHSLNGTTIITSNGNLPMIIKVRGLKGE